MQNIKKGGVKIHTQNLSVTVRRFLVTVITVLLTGLIFNFQGAFAEESGSPVKAESSGKFQVQKIVVEGNSSLEAHEIANLVAPYEGKMLGLDDLNQLAGQLTETYRKKGFLLAKAYVPSQEIAADGTAKVQVMEGKVGEIKIEGNKHYSESFIRNHFSQAVKDGSFNYEEMQRALLLLNEFPDLKVRAVLMAGKESGNTDIVLKVEDKDPFHVGLDYNNYGNEFTGENRAGLDVSHGNVTGRGDMLFGRAVWAFPSDEQSPFVMASYSMPIDHEGNKLTFSYANADIRVGRELSVLDIRGEANIYGVTATMPLRRTTTDSSNITASFYSKDMHNFILGQTSSHDKMREVAAGYNTNWVDKDARNFFTSSLTIGLGELLDGMEDNDPFASRFRADNSFTKGNLDYARIQKFNEDLFMIMRAGGQFSFNPLVVGEQYSIGGADSVRGYKQSEYLGDHGYNISAELRIPFHRSKAYNWQGAVFLDHAWAGIQKPLPGERKSRSLTGGGVGVRAGLGEHSSLRLDVGFPFSPNPNISGDNAVFYGQFQTRF